MNNTGCLHCLKQKNQYSWSGADLYVSKEIFTTPPITIVEILENPWQQERYPLEEVLQCDQCNTVWHIKYHFPGKPPLHVSAKIIPKKELPDFFLKIGGKLSEKYKAS